MRRNSSFCVTHAPISHESPLAVGQVGLKGRKAVGNLSVCVPPGSWIRCSHHSSRIQGTQIVSKLPELRPSWSLGLTRSEKSIGVKGRKLLRNRSNCVPFNLSNHCVIRFIRIQGTQIISELSGLRPFPDINAHINLADMRGFMLKFLSFMQPTDLETFPHLTT